MSKQLNETAIVNELTGASLYFPQSQPDADTRRKTDDERRLAPPAVHEPPAASVSADRTVSAETVPPTSAPPSTPSPSTPPLPASAEPSLDLGDMPFRKLTCLLTPAEHRALDLLKIELSATLDGPVTKEQLARCAIHYLVADYRTHGGGSPILAPLKRKRSQW